MTLKILIAGAGLGGLAAASCLMKAGHDVEIYEAAPRLGEIGAGIQISANAMHVMHNIGLGAALDACAVRPGAYVFRLHDTGEEISRFSLADEHERMHKAPYLQLHRADLHELLARRARDFKPDLIHLNKTALGFTEMDDHVELHLADGSSAKGDLLIGADGVKSAIRKQIAGDAKPTFTGDVAWRLTVPTEKLPPNFMPPVMSVWMGPGAHVVCYYLRAGALLNFVGLVETDEVNEESWTAKFPWEKLKADFVGWHPDIQTIIDATDRNECYRWSLFFRPPIENWSTRRATMLGDAVHATLPYLAQGACMAIEDGAVLTRALGMEPDIAAALQLYQRNRLERTARIVNNSGVMRDLYHSRDQATIRQHFAKRNEGGDRNAWLYSYNPLTVPLA